MIYLIIGEKGKGKTKILLERANTQIRTANGNIVYLDKSKQHMYELNNRIRLIDVTGFPIENTDAFTGFLCGLISRDNDLEMVYLDSFLKIAQIPGEDVSYALDKIISLSRKYDVDFTISISVTKAQLPERFFEYIVNE